MKRRIEVKRFKVTSKTRFTCDGQEPISEPGTEVLICYDVKRWKKPRVRQITLADEDDAIGFLLHHEWEIDISLNGRHDLRDRFYGRVNAVFEKGFLNLWFGKDDKDFTRYEIPGLELEDLVNPKR